MSKHLTEPDEQISADDMETLSLDLLSALPMEGVEGRSTTDLMLRNCQP
jgi:hypothetical protein